MALTVNKSIEKPANGADVDTWDVNVNADWDIIDAVFGNTTTINVVGASGTTALTVAQYRPQYFVFSGLLTANVNYQLPTGIGGQWALLNITTGAFTVTFSSAGGGTSLLLPRSSIINVRSDGTNIFTYAAASGANADITSLNALAANITGTGLVVLATSPTLTTPNVGVATGSAAAGPATASGLGYMGAPVNTQNANYTLALSDEGEMIYHTSASAHAYTIPPNASVALPIGTVVLIENEVAGGVVTVTRGAAVSLFWRGNSVTSADRALAANGSCAIKKVATDTWSITGIGLT
jgi:hypothetical protein